MTLSKILPSGKIALFAAFFVLALGGCKGRGSVAGYYTMNGVTQGTTYHIVFEPRTASDSSFTAVRNSVETYFTQIDNALSGYNPNSVLSAFNNCTVTQFCDPSSPKKGDLLYKMFIDNFIESRKMFALSDGLFDVSAAPLFDLWGFGFKEKVEITQPQIDSVMQFIGMQHFTLLNEGKDDALLIKDDARCKLNFNAIAQGYTVDYVAARFDEMGMENYLIEVGGEVYAKGVNAKGEAWKVGIDSPVDGNDVPGAMIQAVVELTGKGLVTSGDYRKFYMKDGKKISHTINPKTGYPVEHNLLSATVIASNATIADAYATYLMASGLEGAMQIVEQTPGIEALLIFAEQDQMKTWMSKGMKDIVKKN